jgi:hypothetical protein
VRRSVTDFLDGENNRYRIAAEEDALTRDRDALAGDIELADRLGRSPKMYGIGALPRNAVLMQPSQSSEAVRRSN